MGGTRARVVIVVVVRLTRRFVPGYGNQLPGANNIGLRDERQALDTAEVAVVVQDNWQRKGLGPRLLSDLLAAAEARGIVRFRADILADNRRMLGLLSRLTNVEKQTIESGVVTVSFRRREDGLRDRTS